MDPVSQYRQKIEEQYAALKQALAGVREKVDEPEEIYKPFEDIATKIPTIPVSENVKTLAPGLRIPEAVRELIKVVPRIFVDPEAQKRDKLFPTDVEGAKKLATKSVVAGLTKAPEVKLSPVAGNVRKLLRGADKTKYAGKYPSELKSAQPPLYDTLPEEKAFAKYPKLVKPTNNIGEGGFITTGGRFVEVKDHTQALTNLGFKEGIKGQENLNNYLNKGGIRTVVESNGTIGIELHKVPTSQQLTALENLPSNRKYNLDLYDGGWETGLLKSKTSLGKSEILSEIKNTYNVVQGGLYDTVNKPIKLFKGVGGENANINRMAWGEHFADNKKLASEYGTVISGETIPKGTKIANLDVLKNEYRINQKIADPKEITQDLLDKDYEWAKGTMPDGQIEYVKLQGNKTGWNSAKDWMPGEAISWNGETPETSKFVIADIVDDSMEATGKYGLFSGDGKLIKSNFKSTRDAERYAEGLKNVAQGGLSEVDEAIKKATGK